MIKGKNQSFKLLRHTKFVSFQKIIRRGREDNASTVSILVNKKGKIKSNNNQQRYNIVTWSGI